MIEIVKNIIDLVVNFIEGLFKIQIDLAEGFYISLGDLFIGFLVVVLSIYFLLLGLGVISKGDGD